MKRLLSLPMQGFHCCISAEPVTSPHPNGQIILFAWSSQTPPKHTRQSSTTALAERRNSVVWQLVSFKLITTQRLLRGICPCPWFGQER
jgi:hypothetical protein